MSALKRPITHQSGNTSDTAVQIRHPCHCLIRQLHVHAAQTTGYFLNLFQTTRRLLVAVFVPSSRFFRFFYGIYFFLLQLVSRCWGLAALSSCMHALRWDIFDYERNLSRNT
jgi:hypothetical protein